MVFHWQPDLAPTLTDSGSSRFLITTIPSSHYVFEGDVNVTLQCAGEHICKALTDLKIHVRNLQDELVPWF